MCAATNISQPEVGALPAWVAVAAPEFRSRIASISRQSFVYFAGTVLTAGSGYFFKIYLARALGAEALGLYALGMTIVGFAGIFNSLGLPTAAARFVAAYTSSGERSMLAGFLWSALCFLLVLNILLGAAVLLAGPWLTSHFYCTPKLTPYLWAFVAIMALGVLNTFFGQVMAGYQDVARRTLITHFVGTPANIVMAVALISFGFGLAGYLAAQALSATLVLFLLGAFVWRVTPKSTTPLKGNLRLRRQVVSFSAAAWAMTALQFFLAQGDMVLLGHYVTARQVGVYAVAMALVGFVSIALDSVNQIFSPIISELHTAGKRALLQQLYSALTKWIVILTFPLALGLTVFSHGLMSMFGTGFELGAGVLVLGAIGQLCNCAVGSVGYLLLMSGNEAELIRIQFVNAALLVGLNIILVPRLGITGAAIATTITTITTNLWGLVSVRRLLDIFPYHAGYLRLIVPAALTAASLLIASRSFSAPFKAWQVAGIGLLLGYVTFFASIWLVGFENEDRLLARMVLGRVGRSFRKLAIA